MEGDCQLFERQGLCMASVDHQVFVDYLDWLEAEVFKTEQCSKVHPLVMRATLVIGRDLGVVPFILERSPLTQGWFEKFCHDAQTKSLVIIRQGAKRQAIQNAAAWANVIG